ncbi:MAG: hypothetical protein RMY28_009110 [Nostoc sp. ChiSLP01]|nr:hypothetical protein [Nostoc sp. CmiSLP01]MDZ8285283.1 hypothetical protein [Nostoc sp. ChiSLP01]
MSRAKILDPSESYTFIKYAELAYDSADILAIPGNLEFFTAKKK